MNLKSDLEVEEDYNSLFNDRHIDNRKETINNTFQISGPELARPSLSTRLLRAEAAPHVIQKMLSSRLLQRIVLALVVVSVSLAALAVTAGDKAAAVQAKIDNAMTAAPLSIAQAATILSYTVDADGKFVVLREGTNGWSCQPDDPTTPMNNPICFDEVWLKWIYAAGAGEDPSLTVTSPGFAYMLQGDDTASKTDPGATQPAAGEIRMTSGPLMMILLPASVDIHALVGDEHSRRWVMWAGTPYQHIRVLVDKDAMAGMGS